MNMRIGFSYLRKELNFEFLVELKYKLIKRIIVRISAMKVIMA